MASRKKVVANGLFLVVKIGYEYNDEIMGSPEGDLSEPVIIYKDKAKADAEVLRLTIEHLKTTDVLMYGYGEDEIFKDLDVAHSLAGVEELECNGWEPAKWQLDLLKDKDKVVQFINNLRMKFYEVKEVELA